MKRATVLSLALASTLLLSAGTVYAAGTSDYSNTLDVSAAQTIAYADAGVSEDAVISERTERDRENGRRVYEIKFSANGIRYEYTIDCSDGTICEKEQKTVSAARAKGTNQTIKAETPKPAEMAVDSEAKTIDVTAAKSIALKDAGLSEDSVVVKKAKLDREPGSLVYDVEFFVKWDKEYEYEIDAYSGAILDRDVEAWDD